MNNITGNWKVKSIDLFFFSTHIFFAKMSNIMCNSQHVLCYRNLSSRLKIKIFNNLTNFQRKLLSSRRLEFQNVNMKWNIPGHNIEHINGIILQNFKSLHRNL